MLGLAQCRGSGNRLAHGWRHLSRRILIFGDGTVNGWGASRAAKVGFKSRHISPGNTAGLRCLEERAWSRKMVLTPIQCLNTDILSCAIFPLSAMFILHRVYMTFCMLLAKSFKMLWA